MLIGFKINNRYEIIKKIASGGMADVFLATDTRTNKEVAVKVLHESYSRNKSFVARFKREAQILTNLNSPNIVKIYDWGELDNLYYIIMEYVSGKTLKNIIETRGNIDPETTIKYAIQVCNALQIAHSKGLIHRDIKPQNILITSDGILKITDFGIAKFTSEDATKTISILGTAHYISPEHLEGKVLDARSDIYSLGIVLFEMLTADLPFRGGTSMDIGLRHLSEKPQNPSSIIRGIPEKLDKIVLKCLEKKPENRYRNIDILKSDLEHFLTGDSLSFDLLEESGKQKLNMFSRMTIKNLPASDINIKEKYYSRLQRLFISMLAVLCIFIISSLIFLVLYININSDLNDLKYKSSLIKVPDIKNTDYYSAVKILADYNLKIEIDEDVYIEDIPVNYIVDQEPDNGITVKKNSVISVKVNKGIQQKMTSVPSIIGVSMEKAEEILNEANLIIGQTVEEFSDYVNNNMVMDQDPKPQTQIEIGSEINLTVSKGRQLITIPDVKGYDYIFAKTSIESLGLNTIVKKSTSAETQPGIILAVDPVEGTAVYKNSSVTIYVSTNEQLIVVPNIENMDFSRAESILAGLNIAYEVSHVKVNYSIQKNTVISQIPSPGEQISQNDKIIIFVGE